MVNILVPTDFSKLSKVAIQYAAKMSNKIDGNITLLHVITNVYESLRSDLQERIKATERELVLSAEEDFKPILKETEKHNKTANPVAYKIQKGKSFDDTIKAFVKKNKSGLIVMGTRGASGITKYVLGSNTVSVLDISPIPVLAVPENADFKSFKNVVYASDLKHLERELKVLIPYLKMFDSTLHVLHVAAKGTNIDELQNSIKNTLKKVDYRKSTVTIQVNKKVDVAIDSFVHQLKADLVTMFTHKQSAYDKLFNRSMTKKMAFQSKTPLLAFKSK
jgi:nucleotide-binding universal stress UspA family protein